MSVQKDILTNITTGIFFLTVVGGLLALFVILVLLWMGWTGVYP